MKFQVNYDMFRNAAAPMQGNKFTWAVGGSCFTAQVAPFHPEWFGGITIIKAIWRVCWLPNITNGAQTMVRVAWCDGSSTEIPHPEVHQMAVTSSVGKTNSPQNEGFDVTVALNAAIASHTSPMTYFQVLTEEAGDSTYGPLIYSSALEIVFESNE